MRAAQDENIDESFSTTDQPNSPRWEFVFGSIRPYGAGGRREKLSFDMSLIGLVDGGCSMWSAEAFITQVTTLEIPEADQR